MDPLTATAASPVAVPTIPIEWIRSGAVTPVITTPAATTATAWVPQPIVAAPAPTGAGSLLDAIAALTLGTSAANAGAFAAPAATSPGDTVAVAAPPTSMQLPLTVAPSPAPAPATAAPGAPIQDPTLTSSVTGALAGFAAATGRAVGRVTNVAGAGVSKARKVGTEVWAGVRSPRAVHVSQVPSKYNANPAPGNRDCGPASVVMSLKLLGKSIPGVAAGAAPQKLINRVRQLAGNTTNSVATTNQELERALAAAGTKTREIADAASVRQAVLAGKPVILNGNPSSPGAYGPRFNATQMMPYNGAHWIVVSGIDEKSGQYIINDPLSKIGPVKVSPAELEAYRGGSMGIEVEG